MYCRLAVKDNRIAHECCILWAAVALVFNDLISHFDVGDLSGKVLSQLPAAK